MRCSPATLLALLALAFSGLGCTPHGREPAAVTAPSISTRAADTEPAPRRAAPARAAPDLNDLSQLPGAQHVVSTADTLTYQAPGTIRAAARFYVSQLDRLGWREERSSKIDDPRGFQTGFAKDGFNVFLGISQADEGVQVLLRNGGNVDTRKLPRFPGATLEHGSPTATLYSTRASVPRVAEYLRTALAQGEWREAAAQGADASDDVHLEFRRGAVTLHVAIAVAPGLGGRTAISYSTLVSERE